MNRDLGREAGVHRELRIHLPQAEEGDFPAPRLGEGPLLQHVDALHVRLLGRGGQREEEREGEEPHGVPSQKTTETPEAKAKMPAKYLLEVPESGWVGSLPCL